MVFSSLLFLFRFLPVVLILYYMLPQRCRNYVLLLCSLFFYAWGEPKYVLLMLTSITVDYVVARQIERSRRNGNRGRGWLLVSVIYNLSVLGFFKYTDFLIGTVNTLFHTSIPLTGIPLPIGISFFTFQTMSYTIDVYRGMTTAQKNWFSYGTYVSMFPQLIAGPIVQYKTIADQLQHREETSDTFAEGIARFMAGLGKKVLLANNIGVLWDTVSTMELGTLPAATAWLGAAAYTLQIYFDFSGYSDMAIGLGEMFGFRFLENFNYPYTSKSITEFWRRWHISLGAWFREYVYIPLGGNRHGVLKQIRNLAVVWILTGIWHGASWNFVLWGIYYGMLLILEKFLLKRLLEKLPGWLRQCYTLLLVVLGWVIFAFDDLKNVIVYLKAMFGGTGVGFADATTIYLLYNYAVLLVICILGAGTLPKRAASGLVNRLKADSSLQVILRLGLYAVIFLLSTAYLVNATYNPFLYFRF
ncbi:MAG: MBOAT family O-acyltransferase [Eubacteriales bacterium]|nr:MBOAT family O-acyltransferase [Eubacteriales bacterium]